MTPRRGHHSQTARMQPPATMQASAKRKAPAEKTQASTFRRRASLAMSALIAFCRADRSLAVAIACSCN